MCFAYTDERHCTIINEGQTIEQLYFFCMGKHCFAVLVLAISCASNGLPVSVPSRELIPQLRKKVSRAVCVWRGPGAPRERDKVQEANEGGSWTVAGKLGWFKRRSRREISSRFVVRPGLPDGLSTPVRT